MSNRYQAIGEKHSSWPPSHEKNFSYITDSCNCGAPTAASCVDPLYLGINQSIRVQGMFIGCLPLTSLLHSTLECFYNETCVADIVTAMTVTDLSVSALDSTRPSRYQPNTPLREVINSLMTENWTNSINYSRYYAECSPNECTYSIITKNTVGYIILTVTSLCKSTTLLQMHRGWR